ncbi:fatty acid desaturase family protein [Tabrizicola sp.]|uniref:fatty acid desaturase family protein n=1 Tax=Tabrizicola sp. TaxID=2005166 RepID=UPI002FDE928D
MTRYTRFVAWSIVATYIGLVLGSILLGTYLLSLPLSVATVVAMAATAAFIGTRLRGINNIVHECSHATFAEQRQDNVMIGRFCTAILLKSFRKYRDDHLSHHANNGDYEHDAEFALIEKFGLHDPISPRTILRHVIVPLTGRHLPLYTGINLSAEDGRFFQGLKLLLLALMAVFLFLNPLAALVFVILPVFYIYPTFNFWTDCLDHAGLVGAEDELEASRNVLAPAPVRLLFFPRNDSYHLVHHLFPQIPARHLHLAHEELSRDPSYRRLPSAVRAHDRSTVERSLDASSS